MKVEHDERERENESDVSDTYVLALPSDND